MFLCHEATHLSFILGLITVTPALSVLEAKTILSYSWQEFLNRE